MAWTTPRDWTAGELVTEAIMDTHVRDNFNAVGPIQKIRKTADETVTSSATPQNDDHLSFAIAANEIWEVRLRLTWSNQNVANSNLRATWSVPSGATGFWAMQFVNSAGNAATWGAGTDVGLGTALVVGSTSASNQPAIAWATIVNSTNAGTVQFQWAQSVSNGTGTIVREDSHLLATRLSP